MRHNNFDDTEWRPGGQPSGQAGKDLALDTMQDWVDVTLRTSLDPAELLSLLNDSAVCGAWQDNEVIHLYWPASDWNADRALRIRDVCAQMGSPVTDALLVGTLPHRDWNESWARAVQPIRLGRVVVRPSWRQVTSHSGDVELVIDPKQAFGTGHHATTQLMIEWLQEIIMGGESVLDLGTGSGILAMVALRLGAERAVGIDHDPVAIECARQYASQNGFGDELSLQMAAMPTQVEVEPFMHLVMANLDRQTILDSVALLAAYARRGARLLLSGILAEQLAEITAVLARESIYVEATRERDGWVALQVGVVPACDDDSERAAT